MLRKEGEFPDIRWADSGEPIVISRYPEDNEDPQSNAIDPCAFIDDDGTWYLVYGGGQICIVELDPTTGKVKDSSTEWSVDNKNYHIIANGPQVEANGNKWIEAPFLYKRNGYYYLFVNWYTCCNGLKSTYEIRVGRSESPTGPFIDKDGEDIRNGGGTLSWTELVKCLETASILALVMLAFMKAPIPDCAFLSITMMAITMVYPR